MTHYRGIDLHATNSVIVAMDGWLVDGLMGAGFRLRLANPAAIHQYSGLKHSDDEDDEKSWGLPPNFLDLRIYGIPEAYMGKRMWRIRWAIQSRDDNASVDRCRDTREGRRYSRRSPKMAQ